MKPVKDRTVIRVLLDFTLVLSIFLGQSDATCTSPDISESAFAGIFLNPRKIEPGAAGVGVVAEFSMIDTLSVTINDNLYLGITFSQNRLVVSVLDAFTEYEETSTSLRFDGSLVFTCNGLPSSRTLIFRQEIEQRNNYPPNFPRESYDFILPLPLPQNLVITSLLQPPDTYPIYTLDNDLGDNNNVAYRIEGASFLTVSTEKDSSNPKRFNAVLRTSQAIMRLAEPLIFTLYATDNGPEPRTTTNTKITLSANPEEPPVDPPHFEKALYIGNINDEGALTLPEVVLVKSSYNSDVTFALAGDDSQYFGIQVAENVVTITLVKPVPEEMTLNFLSCWVEARSSVALTGRTALVVQLPQIEAVQQMTFGKAIYVGNLKKTNELTLEDIVLAEENYDETVKFTLAGADMQHFDFTNDRNIVKLQPKAIAESVLLSRYFFSLQIRAENDKSVTTTTTVIVENENFQTFLKFEKSLYTGSLTEASALTLEDAVIDMSTYLPGITVELVGEHKDWFTATLTNNLVAIGLQQPVPEANLNGLNSIELVLVASKSGLTSANAVISIVITRAIVVDPKFEQRTYSGRLTEEGSLQLPTIRLSEETYTSDVEFSFQDASGFFEMTNEGNLVVISLKSTITREDWTALNSVTLIVGASKPKGRTEAHSAVVLDIIKTEANSPRFEKSLYVGKINEVRELVLENVVVASETYGPDVQLTLIGDDFELFTYENVDEVLTVRLTRPLTDADVLGKAMLKFVLEAFRQGAAATQTAIVLSLPSGDLKILRFEKALYRGTLNPNNDLTMTENVVLLAAVYEPNVKFAITDDSTGVFEITAVENVVSVRLARLLSPEELSRWHALSFSIVASLEGAISGVATVAIEVTRSNLITPVFEKRTYRGSFDDSLALSIEKLVIVPETYTPQVEISLSGAGFELFRFTNAAGVITMETQRPMTEEDFAGRSYFQLEMLAKRSDAEFSIVGILIDVPLKECDIPPADQPYFEYANYHFRIQTDTTGLFGTIEARVADPSGVLRYSMDTNNPYVLANVQIDAQRGELKLINVLIAGEYEFAVLVTNTNSGKNARSSVLLTVESQKLCPGEKVNTVAKSLMIAYLEENSRHDIMSTVADKCEYEIVTVEPNDKQYFSIDQSEKRLIATPFDREDVIFQGSAVPQFQVKLKLNCLEDVASTRQYRVAESNSSLSQPELKLSPVDPNGNYLVATKDVFYSHDVTTLNVIVKDLNDNAPQFTNPQSTSGEFVLGYPDAEIAEKIIPPYLFKVEAKDNDEGLHALIRYSINANNHFDINPKSGVIFPLTKAMSDVDEVEIEIEARDMDGVLIGSQATQQKMLVKRLKLEHLIVLTVADEKSENIEQIIDYIKVAVGLDIRVLNQAMVSTKTGAAERSLRQSLDDESSVTSLRLIVYGFDADNELQDADEIEEYLGRLGSAYRISLLPVADFACLENVPEKTCENSKTGLIVGISVLGGLLLLACVVGGAFFYIFGIPYLRSRGEDSSIASSKANLADDFNMSPPTSSPTMGDTQKRSSVYIEGTTLQESESDQVTQLSKSLGTMLEDEGSFYESTGADSPKNVTLDIPDSPKDRTKTIKFNELVERIEVSDDGPDEYDENDGSIKL